MGVKYYAFTRVNPRISDYETLVRRCRDADAYLAFRTIDCGLKKRLVGFIVFWDGERDIPNAEGMFPNFNLTPFSGDCVDVHTRLDRLFSLVGGAVGGWYYLFGGEADDLCDEFGLLNI